MVSTEQEFVRNLRKLAEELRDEANTTHNGVRECERVLDRVVELFFHDIRWVRSTVETADGFWGEILHEIESQANPFREQVSNLLRCSAPGPAGQAAANNFLSLLGATKDKNATRLKTRIKKRLASAATVAEQTADEYERTWKEAQLVLADRRPTRDPGSSSG